MTVSSLDTSVTPVSYDSICDFEEWVTLTVDTAEFERLQARLRGAQEASGRKDLHWAHDRILRATAFETGAVEDLYDEGATYSVAMETDGWEQELADSGDGAGQHFEDQLAAYLVIQELAAGVREQPLTEAEIREIHRPATSSQKTYKVWTPNGYQDREFVAGVYKTEPNQVNDRAGRTFYYAPVEDVPPEMARLVATMRSPRYAAAHPVIQCAYVHWAIAHVHPFADGNGRMARVISSLPLFTAFGIPLAIFSGRKKLYLQALEAADRHAHQEKADYVSSRAIETLSWLAELIESSNAEDEADGIVGNIGHLLKGDGVMLETARQAAIRLKAETSNVIERECARRFGGTKIRYQVTMEYVGGPIDKSYERRFIFGVPYVNDSEEVRIALSVDEVEQLSTSTSVQFGYTSTTGCPPLVVEHDAGTDDVYFNLEDCSPNLSVSAEMRIRTLASTVVVDATRKFERDLADVLKQHGRHHSDGV
ncbi:Fic family protein [Arthrobacter sp. PAMC 25486]|uniref:Fic family protein n=1 Tax=Arthrobacter sp. PAMC 25486 TaxID=1494608 RepID=UPI0012FEFE63|nr:Fic family protein [Arthrobacter sp. PAMC 25486]